MVETKLELAEKDFASFEEEMNKPETPADEKAWLAALLDWAKSDGGGGDWIYSWAKMEKGNSKK